MSRRTGALLLVLVAAALQLGARRAPGAAELAVAPASGAVGSSITVTGRGFTPGPIVLHWDGEAGAVLAHAAGPAFSVTATVPDGPAGTHQLFAVADDAEESAAFEVTGAGTTSARAAPDPVRSGSGVGGGTGAAAEPDVPVTTPPTTAGAGAAAAADSPTVPAPTPAPGAGASATGVPGAGGAGGAGASATGAAGAPGAPGADGAAGGSANVTDGGGAPGGQDVPQVGTGLAAAPSTRHSGGARSPVALAVGLVMVLGGGAFLVIRHRRSATGGG